MAAVSLPDSPGAAASSTSATAVAVPATTVEDSTASMEGQTASAAGQSDHKDGQTKRILGIVPNFRAVSADEHPPKQTVREKFVTATQDSFDYSSVLLPVAVAAYAYGTNQTPEFGKGGVGFGRYLWHSVVDQTIENYSVEFIVPALTHEDTRYYTLGKGGFLKRTGYSLSRIVVTRNDQGHDTFNAGEIVGAGMASGISNLYYPGPERNFSNTADRWGTNVGIDAATFMFKEFWPDINHHLFHHHGAMD
ncbi:hypothetical protein [Granulicella rosea]|uniref:hypothetical protein n=1 Tax=Granulicella rosea TaxID=474952 RepID=UPI001FE7B00F|nr:hypothetical protein [Granulicella rosea]